MKFISIRNREKYPLVSVIVYFAIIVVLVAIDQGVKLLVVTRFHNADLPLIGNFIRLYYTENTGAAFSTMQNMRLLLILATVVMVVVCMILIVTNILEGRAGNIALALISAGGLGNLIDRIFRGYVIDYIYPAFIRFAIFNIADCCVVVGAVLLCIYLLVHERKTLGSEKAK
jgi:signal peptidase II